LSDEIQRIKRLFFFSLANEVFASSNQFVLELESYLRQKRIRNLFFRKKVIVDRMGVSLDRIRKQNFNVNDSQKSERTSLIFASRVAAWKGFGKFVQIAYELGNDYDYLVLTSRFHHRDVDLERSCEEIGARVAFGTNIARVAEEKKHTSIPG